jgi:pimeloyl-ACP methyl ester carboxylesterase
LVLAEPPVISLFASIPPKPTELLKLLLTKPRTAASIIKFGATGIAPATKAAERGDMQAAIDAFGPAVLGRKTFRELSDSRLEQIHTNAIRAEFVGSGFAPLSAGEVRGVQAPTLLITGQRSPRLFHRLADGIHALLPHAERLEIPGASHILHEDNPEAFNAGVLRFVAGHELAS